MNANITTKELCAECARRTAGSLKRIVLLLLVPIPTILIWITAWRIVMPEGAATWRYIIGWCLVWIGHHLYNFLNGKQQNADIRHGG